MPENFDWVSARFGCSIARIFKELEITVKSDVDNINRLEETAAAQSGGAPTREIWVSNGGRRFSANRKETGGNLLKSVEFALESNGISVKSDYPSGPSFSATIRLNNDGRCLLLVADTELELWQVRRKALEDLFFGAPRQEITTVKARKE